MELDRKKNTDNIINSTKIKKRKKIKTIKEECPLCIENFNKNNRKKISCTTCNYSTCKSCFKRYLLSSFRNADCMNCKKGFDKIFLYKNIGKTWVNTVYAKHRENILIEHEKSLMPETQNDTQKYLLSKKISEKRKEMVKKINDLNENYRDSFKGLQIKIHKIKGEIHYSDNLRKKNELLSVLEKLENKAIFYGKERIIQIKKERINFNQFYSNIIKANLHLFNSTGNNKNKERRKFIRRCPVENCKGFLSTQYKCPLCETFVCPKCNGIKKSKDDENHVCDPNDVKNMEYLKSQTKPCPQCGISIYKISGCSQMWCTSCKIPFDWNTLKIVRNSRIHNPHFYEWKQNSGNLLREHGDIPCGGLPHFYKISSAINRLVRPYKKSESIKIRNKITDYHRIIIHIQDVELRRYRPIENNNEKYKKLRIQFMANELNENKWKILVQRREKNFDKKRDMFFILEMFSDVMTDKFREFVLESKIEKIQNTVFEMDKLIDYFNKQMEQIGKFYVCIAPQIGKRNQFFRDNHNDNNRNDNNRNDNNKNERFIFRSIAR